MCPHYSEGFYNAYVRDPGFSFAEDTDDLFVGKTLLQGGVLMWLMKTLLSSRCINQRGAGHHGHKEMRYMQ
ncbi:hypothetical protein CGB80_23280 [Klebsiella sp. 11332]|nr:hypothetical protein [Klebsiella michiganensis]MBW6033058.1 hypothetical protein [Klebsiella sp. CVUAS 11332]